MASPGSSPPPAPSPAPAPGVQKGPGNISIGLQRDFGSRISRLLLGDPNAPRKPFLVKVLILIVVIGVVYFVVQNPELTKAYITGAGEEIYTWLPTDYQNKLTAAYNAYFYPEETLAQQEGDVVKPGRQVKRVELKNLRAEKPSYSGNEPVEISANILGRSLTRDTPLQGICTLTSGGKKTNVNAEFPDNEDSFKKDVPVQSADAICVFPEGAEYNEGNLVKNVKMRINYLASAESSWKAYTAQRAIAGDALSLIEDSDLDNDGFMKTSSLYQSPMVIGFASGVQPYYENQQKKLTLTLKKNTGVEGNLLTIHSLLLSVPPSFSLLEGEGCAFEDSGNSEEGSQVYRLKKQVMDYYNANDCSKAADESKCVFDYKDKLAFSCNFQVLDASQGIPKISLFTAKADYEFQITDEKTFKVLREGSDVAV